MDSITTKTLTFLFLALLNSTASYADNWVRIPAGDFFMGTNKTQVHSEKEANEYYGLVKPWYEDEWPQRKIHLPTFYIDQYEVTHWRYRQFVIETNAPVPLSWVKNGYLLDRAILSIATLKKLRELSARLFRLDVDTRTLNKEQLLDLIEKHQSQQHDFPIVNIDWYSAKQFCAWVGGRLPTEAEWEKAARGTQKQPFPWGEVWDDKRLNVGEHPDWLSNVTPVGTYPKGKSPYGVYDMAGNAMEWTASDYQPYSGSDYDSEAFNLSNKVVRGGGWGGMGHYVIRHFYRTAYRFYLPPDTRFNDVGFRCVKEE